MLACKDLPVHLGLMGTGCASLVIKKTDPMMLLDEESADDQRDDNSAPV